MAFVLLALEHAHPWQFIVSAALLGTGISFAFASMANLIVGAVPQSEVGVATGINTIMRTVGGAFGAAVATAILTGNTIARRLAALRERLYGGVRAVGGWRRARGGRRAARAHARGAAGTGRIRGRARRLAPPT